MHTTYDNLTDQEFIRTLERSAAVEPTIKEAIINRLFDRVPRSEYQRGYRAGIESADGNRGFKRFADKL